MDEGLRKKLIFIADYEGIWVIIIKKMLGKEYETIGVTHMLDVDFYLSSKDYVFDLIILENNMQVTNVGITTLQALRRRGNFVPVILHSQNLPTMNDEVASAYSVALVKKSRCGDVEELMATAKRLLEH